MTTNMFTLLFLGIFISCKADYPFRNISLPWNDRVDDLVQRLSLQEIVPQMANSMPAPGIPRLAINPYDWDTECLRGDVGAGDATSFPQSIGLAASFSPALIYTIGQTTGVEVRAKNNNFTKAGIFDRHTGLSCFSPVINIMRHPLWGRNQETYGEDPFMNGLYAQHFVTGLQGDHPRYVRASAGCKHFDVHGGPDNIPVSRGSFDVKVSTRDWRLTFLPAFRMCKEAGTYSFMCSYNAINGVPACANWELLTDVLRNEWGFTGYVVSDQGAIEGVQSRHNYTKTSVETVAACVNAGCNLELSKEVQDTFMDMGYVVSDQGAIEGVQSRHNYTKTSVETVAACVNAGCNLELSKEVQDTFMDMAMAVAAGILPLETVVERVKPLFYTRMRLGEFDPPEMNPYKKLDISVVESPEHVAISKNAAIKSIVMLKNNGLLPLNKNMPIQNVAVVGPMADNKYEIFGDYSAGSPKNDTVTPYMALKTLSENTRLASGCSTPRCTDYKSADIVSIVTGADLVFVCLGTGQIIESEDNDRADMNLPGQQLQLLQDAVKYAKGAPVVLLLYNAGPLDITWADSNDGVSAIFEGFFPAQEAGNAFLEVLVGGESPAGRLPYTWYESVDQTPEITNYTMSERTYRYFTGEPLYPFGYGLCYSTFTYTDLSVKSPVIQAGQDQMVSVSLYNSGNFTSDEVVQVYISWSNNSSPMPNLQLVYFDRLSQLPVKGSPVIAHLPIQAHQMAQWDDSANQFFIEPGTITVYAGGQQPNQKRNVGSNVLTTSFQIKGSKYIGRF